MPHRRHTERAQQTGDFAINMLNQITADKCFLGVNGMSLDEGIGTSISQEVNINKIMLQRSSKDKFILASSSKINKKCNFQTGTIDSFTHLITDYIFSKDELDFFHTCNIEILNTNNNK